MVPLRRATRHNPVGTRTTAFTCTSFPETMAPKAITNRDTGTASVATGRRRALPRCLPPVFEETTLQSNRSHKDQEPSQHATRQQEDKRAPNKAAIPAMRRLCALKVALLNDVETKMNFRNSNKLSNRETPYTLPRGSPCESDPKTQRKHESYIDGKI